MNIEATGSDSTRRLPHEGCGSRTDRHVPGSRPAIGASLIAHGVLLVCLELISAGTRADSRHEQQLHSQFADQVEQLQLDLTEDLLAPLPVPQTAAAPGSRAAATLLPPSRSPEVFRNTSSTSGLTGDPAWKALDVTEQVTSSVRLRGHGGPSLSAGTGIGPGNGPGNGDGFFGHAIDGRRVVFVLDCSRSMNHPHESDARTRFKRLKLELVRSVASMSSEQEFFIVFFNDGAVPMPSPGPVAATLGAKQRYLNWMQTLRADGNTDPITAMQLVLRFRPDVVYFLTDGSFIHRTQMELLRLPFSGARLHTFAFEEVFEGRLQEAYHLLIDGQRDAARETIASTLGFRKAELAAVSVLYLKRLAERHGGTFHLIPHRE